MNYGSFQEKGFRTYIDQIIDYPLIDRYREIELARRRDSGDDTAIQSLMEANLRLVILIAKRYLNRGLSLDDLVQEGNLGLHRASVKFDGARGVRFSTYAVGWIRSFMDDALTDQGRTIRLPVYKFQRVLKAYKGRTRLERLYQRKLMDEEVAMELGYADVEDYLRDMSLLNTPISLDALNNNGDTLGSSLPSGDNDVLDSLNKEDIHRLIERGLSRLTPRERSIICLYYGLDGEEEHTLLQLGREYGISKEYVRQIKERVLERLRKGKDGEVLRECYNE